MVLMSLEIGDGDSDSGSEMETDTSTGSICSETERNGKCEWEGTDEEQGENEKEANEQKEQHDQLGKEATELSKEPQIRQTLPQEKRKQSNQIEWINSKGNGSRTVSGHNSRRTISSGLSLANKGYAAISSPEALQDSLPVSEILEHKITNYRLRLSQILNTTTQSPLVVVLGPQFIKSKHQISLCSQWISSLLGNTCQVPDLLPQQITNLFKCKSSPKHLMLSIRANLANYTTPNVSGSMQYSITDSIPFCRKLLLDICEICPTVANISDTISPQYFSDLFCFGLVSSTLTESQVHRELCSGVSYPIGFGTCDSQLSFDRDSYPHKIQSALDANFAASHQHQFLSVTKWGTVAVVGTAGNNDTFVIINVDKSLNCEDLMVYIDTVYGDKNLKFSPPRIVLDVGKLSNSEYIHKLSVVRALLTHKKYMGKILGVMVDSGDNYGPGFESVGESHTLSSYYEYFVNADKFVGELEVLSSQRCRET